MRIHFKFFLNTCLEVDIFMHHLILDSLWKKKFKIKRWRMTPTSNTRYFYYIQVNHSFAIFRNIIAHTVHVICSPENENVRAATHDKFQNFKWGGFHWTEVYRPFCPCSCSPENKGFALKTHDIVRLMKQIFLKIQFLKIDMMFSFIEATRLFFMPSNSYLFVLFVFCVSICQIGIYFEFRSNIEYFEHFVCLVFSIDITFCIEYLLHSNG